MPSTEVLYYMLHALNLYDVLDVLDVLIRYVSQFHSNKLQRFRIFRHGRVGMRLDSFGSSVQLVAKRRF